jgi:hypothetical protein
VNLTKAVSIRCQSLFPSALDTLSSILSTREKALAMLKEYNETRTITVNKHAHITDDDE